MTTYCLLEVSSPEKLAEEHILTCSQVGINLAAAPSPDAVHKGKMKKDDRFEFILFVLLAALTIFTGMYIGTMYRSWGNLAPAIKIVQMTNAETAKYKEAIVKQVSGDTDPLQKWLNNLQKQKKYGFLPPLPSGTESRRCDIYRIDNRPVLTAPNKLSRFYQK